MWIHHVDPPILFSLPTFFLIIATLPTITEQVPSRVGQPDWTECTVQTGCFCVDTASNELTIQLAVAIPAQYECAKAGAQNKFFTADSALIQFHISGEAAGNKLMLLRGGTEKFGCEFDKSGKATLTGDNTLLKKHRMVLFEDRSRSAQGYSLCAIKAERIPELYKVYDDNREAQAIVLSIDGASAINYPFAVRDGPHNLFKVAKINARKCDPFSFEDKTSLNNHHVLPIMNRDKDVLDCSSYEDDSYTMRYDEGDVVTDLKSLSCVEATAGGPYHYVLNKGDGQPPTPLLNDAKYTIYCAAPIGKVCQNPFDCPPGPECPTFDKGLPNEPAKLKCLDKKWRINDEYLKLAADPECKADPMSGDNAAAFFISQESGADRRVDGARCFTDYDCNKTAPIFLDDSMEYSNGEVKCADRSIVMEVHFYEKNETLPVTSFACDKAGGQWKNKTSSGALTELIPAGSQLRCTKADTEAAPQTGEVKFSEGTIIGIIVGSSVGFLILAALVIFGVLYYKKKRRVKTIDKDALRKMDQAERIKHCRDFFPSVLNTSPTSVHHIIDGLMEIDVLLEMEIEDPDVWAAVYPFIMRLHGAIFRMDRGVGLMFDRYLYLQAKSIIDKHGWTCKKPIRKNSTDGLIRCVAINLLSCALIDGVGKDPKRLLLKGFRELRFQGKTQYPHCGSLWSLVSHARLRGKNSAVPGKHAAKTWNTVRKFNDRLKAIAEKTKDIPPDELIPNFGSVAEQAIFAHGGWQSTLNHVNNFGAFLRDHADSEQGKKIALTYMAGMACSPSLCPAQSIFLATAQFPTPSVQAYALLCKTAPIEEWGQQVEKAFSICINYGRHMDANKLEERFITNSREPSAKIKQMCLEQKDFAAAMDKQMEEIREWYAEHTDKDEYKKKPVYAISDKFKQYYRKYQPAPAIVDPKLNPGNGPKSAGETKSNSDGAPTGKSQTDVKSSDGSSDSKNTPTPEKPAPETAAPVPAPTTPGPPST